MPAPKKARKATLTKKDRKRICKFFNENGITFSDWAKERGFNASDCFNVVYTDRKCTRGKAFKVAKMLKEFALQSA